MITRIAGILEGIDEHSATLAPSEREPEAGVSVAYEVLLPGYLAQRLRAQVGRRVALVTLQYLESQGQGASFIPRLVGFASAHERDFFEVFTTVKGIGNRKALRALAIDPAAVARAIVGKDARALQQLPEIGKRLAETIIAELSGKVESYLSPAEVEHLERGAGKGAGAPAEGPASEAIDTLVALGETRSNAEFLVGRAAERAGRAGRSSPSAAELVELVYAAGR